MMVNKQLFRNIKWFIRNIWVFRKHLWEYRTWDFDSYVVPLLSDAILDSYDDMERNKLVSCRGLKQLKRNVEIIREFSKRQRNYESKLTQVYTIKRISERLFDIELEQKHTLGLPARPKDVVRDELNQEQLYYDAIAKVVQKLGRRFWT